MREEIRDFRDYNDDEIRAWAHHEVGVSFVAELKEARAVAVETLVQQSRTVDLDAGPIASAGGAIGILDRILFMLRVSP